MIRVVSVFSVVLLWSAGLQAEEQCALKLAASLELLDNPAGTPIVPVIFNGRPAKMVLDTGAYWSGIVPSAAAGLKTTALRYIGLVGAGGGVMRTAVLGSKLQVGNLNFPRADFFIFARDNAQDPDLIGNIGANILQHYDVEIDYPGHKVRIFLQDHCPGRVVSWPHGEIAEIPFKLNKQGHISLPVSLDGHDYRALLDTGATASLLDKQVADEDFGLTRETAKAVGTSDTLDGKDLPTFYHRFGLLDLGGLKFNNTQVAFSTGQETAGSGWEQERMPSMILGMHQLRRLHLYIAYGERMIYASAVNDPHLPLDAIDQQEIGRLVASAEQQLAAERYGEAVSLLTQALRIGPDEVSLYSARAFALLKSGDLAAGIVDLDHARRLAPSEIWILSNLALAHRQAGDLTAASADLDEVIRLDPQSSSAFAGRCSLEIEAHRLDAAVSDCDQALALDAKDQEARLNRAYLNLQRGKLDLAQADCEAILAGDPQSAPALEYLGQIGRARGGKSAKPAAPGPKPN